MTTISSNPTDSQPDSAWERNVEALRRFTEQNGHARVPARHVEDGIELRSWVTRTRQSARAGKLTAEQIEQLDAMGFAWDARAADDTDN